MTIRHFPWRLGRQARRASTSIALLVGAMVWVTGCGSGSSESDEGSTEAGGSSAAGASGSSGASGKAGSSGASGKAGGAGASGQPGAGGSSGAGGASGQAGASGKAGSSGSAGQAGQAGSAGSAGSAGKAGQAGQAGSAGQAGQAGSSGQAGQAGQAGSAGSGNECAGMAGLGDACSTGLKGLCGEGHKKCVQGVLSCVPDFPEGKPEECNGKDDDCDGVIDNGLPTKTFYQDNDGDGFGTTATVDKCQAPAGYVDKSGDCNDNNKDIYPGAAEICNGTDDNCDGTIDEGAAKNTYFVDDDGDGFGTTATVMACALGNGLADKSGDCNDNNAKIHPSAAEECNGLDDNCDGQVDEGVPQKTFYEDKDGDGFGSTVTTKACQPPVGFVDVGGDCNDQNPNINPKGIEICNDADDNCNGIADEGVQKLTFFKDNDGDGFGGLSLTLACTAPAGFVADAGDCNDFNKDIHPGAAEQCNNVDDDCNGLIDDNVKTLTIYKDNDGDGFAPVGATKDQKCDVPVGWTQAKDVDGDGQPDWDCDDTANTVYPGASEICDGKDNNCDGLVDAQCPLDCPGSWPVQMNVPYHTPIRMMDLNGDSLEEMVITDAGGKLKSISSTGQLTSVCPGLSFPTGYGARLTFTVNPNLAGGEYVAQVGTRLFDLNACIELAPSAQDVGAFGVAADIDGDKKLDYAGHWEIGDRVCFKLSTKNYAVQCVVSPSGKPYDSYLTAFDVDGDGVSEVVTVRGRTYPGTDYYDGNIDTFGFDGANMVLKSSVSPGVTGFVGSHMNGLDIADWNNDGYGKVAAAFGGKLVDLKGASVLGAFNGEATPQPASFDVDHDGKLDGTYQGAQVDLDLDGVPEAIKVINNNQLTVVKMDAAGTTLPGWPIDLGSFTWSVLPTVGDADNDGALEVYVPSTDGVVYCRKLGQGTNQRTNVVSRGEPEWVNRTMAKDSYEPNGSYALASPLHFPTKETRAYLTKGDEDYYRIPGVGGLTVQLWSPKGFDYDFYLQNEDGTKTYTQATSGGAGKLETISICVGCTQTPPKFYTLKVVPHDPTKDYSNTLPYVLRIGKSS